MNCYPNFVSQPVQQILQNTVLESCKHHMHFDLAVCSLHTQLPKTKATSGQRVVFWIPKDCCQHVCQCSSQSPCKQGGGEGYRGQRPW